YSVLLPVGFALPLPLPAARCALTAPFHPCPSPPRHRRAVLLSVALSLGSPPPDVIRHRSSVEPGLSSPPAFRPLPERPSGPLTPTRWGRDGATSRRETRLGKWRAGVALVGAAPWAALVAALLGATP